MNLHPMTTRARGVLMALTLVAMPAAANAQTAALPDGKTVLADYHKAIGGKDAFAKVNSIMMSGTFEMPAAGMGGTLAIHTARPNMNTLHVNVPGYGDILSGANGKVAWSIDPQAGARLLESAELTAALEDAIFEAQFRDAAAFKSIETLEKTAMDGRMCYKVKLVLTSGRESVDCYGVEDHLLVSTSEVRPTAGGPMETISTASDYKEFGGLKFPTKLVIQVSGMEQVVTLSKIELNTVPASHFELPPAIKPLVK